MRVHLGLDHANLWSILRFGFIFIYFSLIQLGQVIKYIYDMMCRQLKVSGRLKLDIILQHGCWKLLHQQKKLVWVQTLLKFIGSPNYLCMFSFFFYFVSDKSVILYEIVKWLNQQNDDEKYIIYYPLQTQQRFSGKAKETKKRFKRIAFPKQILAIIHRSICNLFLETIPFLLAKPTIHCCSLFLHLHHLTNARNNLLEIWFKKVN